MEWVYEYQKIGFKAKYIIKDKKNHFITKKGSVLQESRAILRVYTTNNKAS